MARDAAASNVHFELEARNKTWGKEVESMSKIVTIEVDSYDERSRAEETEIGGSRRMWSRMLQIRKVREQVRSVDGNSYRPEYVPIGPCHVDCSSPRIEEEKLCSVLFLESRSMKGGLTGLAEQLEPRVRACYPDGMGHMTPKELSRMLLHDGCYLLCCMVNYLTANADKQLAHMSCKEEMQDGCSIDSNTVVRDTVFLIENQIPMFVLEKIHERVTGGESSALDHIAAFVQNLLQEQLYISKKPRPVPQETSHLLHLVHAYIQPTILVENKSRRPRARTGRWRRAMEYRRHANVQFKRRDFVDEAESSVLDVSLRRGTLWIPRLRVDSLTWTILRNLMALEEHIARRPVTAYCVFMSQVACTVEDVELLRRAGIVEHFLASDEEVAQGFADLCKGVVMDVDNLDRNYLKPTWHDLETRCRSRVHTCMGWLFHHTGLALAFLLAVILLATQLTQAFCVLTPCSGNQPKHY